MKIFIGFAVIILLTSCSENRVNKTNTEQLEINQQDTSIVENQETIERFSDTLIIPIGSSIVTFYNISQSPILTKEFVESNDTLYFEFWDFIGKYGELFNVLFRIDSVDLEMLG